MVITGRILIGVYIILCAIVALALIKTRKSSESVTISDREYYVKTFLTYFLLCLVTTPIIYGIYKAIRKK